MNRKNVLPIQLPLKAGEITETAKTILGAKGFEMWRNNNHATRGRRFIGRKGVPDLAGWQRSTGLACYAEVKAYGDSLSNEQAEFLRSLNKAGGFGFVFEGDAVGGFTYRLFH